MVRPLVEPEEFSTDPESRLLAFCRTIAGGLGGSDWNPFSGGLSGAEPVVAGEVRGVSVNRNFRAVYPGARRDLELA